MEQLYTNTSEDKINHPLPGNVYIDGCHVEEKGIYLCSLAPEARAGIGGEKLTSTMDYSQGGVFSTGQRDRTQVGLSQGADFA